MLVALCVCVVAAVGATGAAVVAQAPPRVQLVGGAAVVLAIATVAVRQRSLLLLVLLVLGIQVLVYKTFGPLDRDVASGALGFYVTNIDVLLIALYGAWLFEGTLFRDLSDGFGRPAILVPVVATVTVLPSLLVAESLTLSMAELFRMGWMLALYIYVGLHVRDRRSLIVLLCSLFVIPFLQAAVAFLQWKTGSTLGLIALGQEADLIARIADSGEIPRPSGTVVHPVFFGALMAEIALLALGVGMSARRGFARLACFAAAGAGLLAMILAQSRAALLSTLAVAGLLILWGLWRRRFAAREVMVALGAVAIAGIVFHGQIADEIETNFGTEHFGVEVDSRLELNQVAMDIIRDSPVIGTGLNNFQTVLPRYDVYGLIFAGNPVHNLYLLVMAETGVVGLVGMVATFLALASAAARLARCHDPLLASIGTGAIAVGAFFIVEEVSVFSLRVENSLLGFWIIAGLVIAALRVAEQERGPRARPGSSQ